MRRSCAGFQDRWATVCPYPPFHPAIPKTWCPRMDLNPHAEALVPKTSVSADSTTRAINWNSFGNWLDNSPDSARSGTPQKPGDRKELVPGWRIELHCFCL